MEKNEGGWYYEQLALVLMSTIFQYTNIHIIKKMVIRMFIVQMPRLFMKTLLVCHCIMD